MNEVPHHFMERVQNAFYFWGRCFRYCRGTWLEVAQHNLAAGFAVIGLVYALGFIGMWPIQLRQAVQVSGGDW